MNPLTGVTNTTQGTVLCETYEHADSAWKRTLGLMFRGSLPADSGMLFSFPGNSSPGIWMLGMRFPIDILFLDHDKEVVNIESNAPPLGLSWRTWRIYSSPIPVSYVLELVAGRCKDTRTQPGDILKL